MARTIPLLAFLASLLPAQPPHQWVAPSRTVLVHPGVPPVQVTAVAASVRILDRAATTTLQFELHNPGPRDQEAVLLVPVPEGAAVSQFAFEGMAAEPTARILGRDEARRLYDEITRKLRDPALLEFAGLSCLRSSVFPVPAGGHQRIRFTYDHVLDGDGDRLDYVLPRSEMLANGAPWRITVELQARAEIGVCYSPSHDLQTTRRGAKALSLRVGERSERDPGAFRLCFTTTADPSGPTAALFAYPDPTIGGGYFLLLANAPQPGNTAPMQREVTLVLDRSGSMAGRKLEQATAAALQVLEALADGEGMQILDYGNDVARAFPRPVAKDKATMAAARDYLAAIRPHGGTNIHDALLEALRTEALPGTLPLVLFLTDGLPTVGPTSEKQLNAMVAAANRSARRVFCFGVGNDVNVPLLDRIADTTRAVTTYVLPEEDVEVKVARTFARLGQPVLAGPELALASDADGGGRLREVMPRTLPDLFAGDQLVVLGQYRGEAPLPFVLKGRAPGGDASFAFTLPVTTASTAYGFVPRLWASRQIGFLVDELRQQGGDLGGPLATGVRDPFHDPRLRELRDEILRLSARFGVLGEYTAFLATEGSRLDDWQSLTMACQGSLSTRAFATRSGIAAVNQGSNLWAQKGQNVANPRNLYLDAEMKAVETNAVQQVCDRAFLRRGNTWIDGNSVARQRLDVDQRIELGSPGFFALVRRLEAESRSGVLSLRGDILLEVDGKNVLVTAGSGAPATETNPIPKETIR
ncbi:MAG: VWA domain-containing protein [Planctomycetes bacterium]|nr:VWA domain-containing protein [Planctomycetota bacterium]